MSRAKYWDKYRQSVKENNESQTDKLNRVLQLTEGFNERLESLQSQLTASQDKTENLTRLFKLQQSYLEAQQEELRELKRQSSSSHSKLDAVERQVEEVQAQPFAALTALREELTAKLKCLESVLDSVSRNSLLAKRLDALEAFRLAQEQRQDGPLDRLKECEINVQDLQRFILTVSEQLKRGPDLKQFEAQMNEKVRVAIDQVGTIVKQTLYKQTPPSLSVSVPQAPSEPILPSPRFGASSPKHSEPKKAPQKPSSKNSSFRSLTSSSRSSPKSRRRGGSAFLRPNKRGTRNFLKAMPRPASQLRHLYEELSQKYD